MRKKHPKLNARPCDATGAFVARDASPPPPSPCEMNDYSPFKDHIQFETADFLYTRNQMSAGHIDFLSLLWAASLAKHNDSPPFGGHRPLYQTIDMIPLGDVPWESVTLNYKDKETLPDDVPSWQKANYDVWYRNSHLIVQIMLANPDFKDEFDYTPIREFLPDKDGGGLYRKDFMSGDWAWKQADKIAEDPATHGSMFVPIILGSDKTTVSVATGQNEYYPLYVSIGNVHNNVRRAHRNALVLIGFLAIPKTDKQFSNDPLFRKFRRQLVHSSLAAILELLKPGMTKPEVVRCPDGHFRHVIYGLGPYIADYPEQALLACVWRISRKEKHTEKVVQNLTVGDAWMEYGIVADIVPFTNDFPQADIHDLLSPDLLHQLIKGTFKDHLITWVEEYLVMVHGQTKANGILADIDRRIAAAPAFSNLRRFPEGRGFKQWTGNDSKALMKCTLEALDNALGRFHQYRKIFQTTGHSLKHYVRHIKLFSVPNGLCSSITESKHIKAVKEPWRRSKRYHALGQMLLINQRLDKLATFRVELKERGMLEGSDPPEEATKVEGSRTAGYVWLARTHQRHYPRDVNALAKQLRELQLIQSIRHFLYTQIDLDGVQDSATVPIDDCPRFNEKVFIYHSTAATFYAPSDPCGIGGMHCEYIRATPSWYGGGERFNCVFVEEQHSDGPPTLRDGMAVARVKCFLSFRYRSVFYPCVLVHWFKIIGNAPDPEIGMWQVKKDYNHHTRKARISTIPLDRIIRATHLMPKFMSTPVPIDHQPHKTFQRYDRFYVNRYIDHHSFETIF
ncbi:hypothetical protein CERSUDRAFT_69258 [Gelatoporia subvermispora B]|uniref:Uncharacterized protein n=1 Tax=Ceriporiopsis subvermispora (strain B) TaxID=914234 RepID=M2P8B4_CERS8|nr:hypothetical protein CERSUDRAFT_69258 [Gelatoporia subvermispora B]